MELIFQNKRNKSFGTKRNKSLHIRGQKENITRNKERYSQEQKNYGTSFGTKGTNILKQRNKGNKINTVRNKKFMEIIFLEQGEQVF
jgi:hypothetical protein